MPFNKWQTHVYIDDQSVDSALIQASDSAGDKFFVNKYGEVKTESELLELQKTSAESEKYLVTLGTLYKKYSYDNLSTPTESQPASVSFSVDANSDYIDDLNLTNNSDGVDFADAEMTRTDLANLFGLSIDDSPEISIGLEHLAGQSTKLSGSEIAFELTNVINERFGDGKNFDFTSATSHPLLITRVDSNGNETSATLDIPTLLAAHSAVYTNGNQVAAEPLAYAINAGLQAETGFDDISVSYDAASQGFRFMQTQGHRLTIS